jgi:hypothetical protein
LHENKKKAKKLKRKHQLKKKFKDEELYEPQSRDENSETK